MYRFILPLVFICSLPSLLFSQTSDRGFQSLTKEKVEAPLEFLASDWTEGRETGTKGAYLASDYIAGLFKLYGLRPMGDMAVKRMSRKRSMRGESRQRYRSYFQNFDILTGSSNPEYELSLIQSTPSSRHSQKLVEGIDYKIRGSFETLEIEAPVAFMGFGIKNDRLKINPYRKTSVKGKIVFILEGFPGMRDSQSENYKALLTDEGISRGQLEREKMDLARQQGALAIIRYNPYQKALVSDDPTNLPFFYDRHYYEGDTEPKDYYQKRLRLPDLSGESEVPVIRVNKKLCKMILGDQLKELMDPGFDLSSFKAEVMDHFRFHLKVQNDQKVIKARNVLGYIEGENPREAIIIGAHYDHVGKYNGFIHNGADDNASGTAGVIALARAFAEKGVKPSKTLIFAGWTGEEQGLWGSKYFVRNLPDNPEIVMNVNLDMISRTSVKDSIGNYLSLAYPQGHDRYKDLFSDLNERHGFDLNIEFKPKSRPRGGSDFASFAYADIPYVYFFAGLHEDYHMPDDELEFLDVDKMVEILRLTYLGIDKILEKDDF